MANLKVEPKFDTNMEAMTTKTPGHCDQWNTRHQQLLDNDEYLKQQKVDGAGLAFSVTEDGILRLTYDDGE